MKRLIYFATSVLLITGCSINEVIDVNETLDQENTIGFIAGTKHSGATRAPIADLSTLTSDASGFVVYGTSADKTTSWYSSANAAAIDGKNNYRFDNNVWGWTNGAPTWSLSDEAYPMAFYAYYASQYDSVKMLNVTPGATPVISAEFTVDSARSKQVDFLAAKDTAFVKPISGRLTLTFEHILSKIDFGISTGNEIQAYIQALGINNVGNKGTYDFVNGEWSAEPTVFASSYNYWQFFSDGTNDVHIQPFLIANNDIKPIYGDTHDKHLILMPQTATNVWTPAKNNLPVNDAHICMIYRMEQSLRGSRIDSIGYDKATDHPNYSGSQTEAKGYTGELFVKVGYPFNAPKDTPLWKKSKGYIYNIVLGKNSSTNGYLIDEKYYDENGNRTDLDVTGDAELGEPISGGAINFNVGVSQWTDNPATDLN
jgi:hypothetical protein